MDKGKLYIFLDLEGVLSSTNMAKYLERDMDILNGFRANTTEENIELNKKLAERGEGTICIFGGSQGFGEYLENELIDVFKQQILRFKDNGYDVKIILTSSASDVIFKYTDEGMVIDEILRRYFSDRFGAEIIDGNASTGLLLARYLYMLDWLNNNINVNEDEYKAVIIDDIYDSYYLKNKPIEQQPEVIVTDGFCGALTVKRDKVHALTYELNAMVISGNCVNKQNYKDITNIFN